MSATTHDRPRAIVPPGAKRLDYWWTVLFTDPIAVPVANLLARRRWLTANQVSVVALVLGVGVGVAFALGTRASLIAGGVLFYLAFVVDCVDGKVARALNAMSARGEALDKLSDGGRRAAASLGLTLWLWRAEVRSDDSLWWAGDGVPANAFLWAIVYAVLAYYFLEIAGQNETRRRSWSHDADDRGRERGWSAALARRRLLPNPGMPDVQALVFILGPVTGLVVPALWLGSAMIAVGIGLNVARSLRR